MSVAPVSWEYYGREVPLDFCAGFVGATQDPATLQIRPAVGWFITHRSVEEDEGNSESESESESKSWEGKRTRPGEVKAVDREDAEGAGGRGSKAHKVANAKPGPV